MQYLCIHRQLKNAAWHHALCCRFACTQPPRRSPRRKVAFLRVLSVSGGGAVHLMHRGVKWGWRGARFEAQNKAMKYYFVYDQNPKSPTYEQVQNVARVDKDARPIVEQSWTDKGWRDNSNLIRSISGIGGDGSQWQETTEEEANKFIASQTKQKPVRVQFGRGATAEHILDGIDKIQNEWALKNPEKAHQLYPKAFDEKGKRINRP